MSNRLPLTAQAPGKLYVTGEYGVVEPGCSAVLIAVNKYLSVTLRAPGSHRGHDVLTAARISQAIDTARTGTDYALTTAVIMEKFRAERALTRIPVDLDVHNDLRDANGAKYGLGSSGAITVATVTAFDALYQLGLSEYDKYRLGLLASIQVAPRASGGDVAACLSGGWSCYTSPDRAKLPRVLPVDVAGDPQGPVSSVTDALASEHFAETPFRRLTVPENLTVLVGWTGRPALTDQLVGEVHSSKQACSESDESFQSLLATYQHIVADVVTGLESGDFATVRDGMVATRTALHQLQQLTGTSIETPALKTLIDLAQQVGGQLCCAKSSGAGGGDCGIVLADQSVDTALITGAWQEAGITPLPIGVSPTGARIIETPDLPASHQGQHETPYEAKDYHQ